MKRSFGDYQRVAKSGSGSLWLGPEHLLVIETTGFLLPFSERYRRIDYANIQSLFWTTSRRRGQLTVVFALLLVIFGGLTYLSIDSPTAVAIWGGLAVLMLTLLVINWVKGPTVDLRVQTAVQVLRIKPVKRLARAEEMIRAITPLCLAHQPQDDGSPAPGASGRTDDNSKPNIQLAGLKPPWPGSNLVRWALACQILAGLLSISDLFVPALAYSIAVWIVEIVGMVLIIAALTRSIRFALPRMVRTSLIGSAVIYGVGFVMGLVIYVAVIVQGISSGEMDLVTLQTDPNTATMRYLAESSFDELGWIGWTLLVWGFFATVFPALGLPGALAKAVEDKAAPPPMPPPPSPPVQGVPEPTAPTAPMP